MITTTDPCKWELTATYPTIAKLYFASVFLLPIQLSAYYTEVLPNLGGLYDCGRRGQAQHRRRKPGDLSCGDGATGFYSYLLDEAIAGLAGRGQATCHPIATAAAGFHPISKHTITPRSSRPARHPPAQAMASYLCKYGIIITYPDTVKDAITTRMIHSIGIHITFS